ncbi:hypothetical protein ElyMa_006540200 [Elysia marginata]|uniref:Uncharacterized protein n=1 Tax=Elysia marginata TaxID=1093978 RepID=A0AAV4IBB0_9GAST|nr:hypothetical protein ElyMa_006540200 [Elysia marginata]
MADGLTGPVITIMQSGAIDLSGKSLAACINATVLWRTAKNSFPELTERCYGMARAYLYDLSPPLARQIVFPHLLSYTIRAVSSSVLRQERKVLYCKASDKACHARPQRSKSRPSCHGNLGIVSSRPRYCL